MGAEVAGFVDLTPPDGPTPKGWNLDEDGWYWRKSRPSDPQIKQRYDIGFDDSTYPSNRKELKVYVRSTAYCRAIDAGKLPQEGQP